MPVRTGVSHPVVVGQDASALAVYLEGIRAGLVGASVIALWFLLVDTFAGRPLYTPTVLGAALFHGGAGIENESAVTPSLELVAGFTWVHYLVFMLIGIGRPA